MKRCDCGRLLTEGTPCPTCGGAKAPAPQAAPRPKGGGWLGMLFAAAMVGVAIGVWWWLNKGGTGLDPKRFLPADAEALAVVRLRELWMHTPAEQGKQWAEELEAASGLRPENIDFLGAAMLDSANEVGWIVVKTRGRYDKDKILGKFVAHESKGLGRARHHVGTTSLNGGQWAVAFLDSNTLLMGSEAGVAKALEFLGAPAPKEGPMEAVLADAAVVSAAWRPRTKGVKDLRVADLLPKELGDGLRQARLRVEIGKTEDAEAETEMTDEAAARKLAEGVEGRLALGRGLLPFWPLEAGTKEALGRLLKFAVAKRTGNTVKLRLGGEAGDFAKALQAVPWGGE